jgi:hypothetical protein
MALENTVAKYTVQIVQEGSVAPAVQEFNSLRAAAQDAAGGTKSLTSGLSEVRGSAMLTHEGFQVLNQSAFLLAGSGFPEVGRAAMLVSASLRATRQAAILTRATLETMFPIIGAIAVVVGGSIGIWSKYSSELAEAKNKSIELADALERLPEILNKISAAQKAGQLNDSDAEKYRKMLSGETPLYTNDPRLTMGNALFATKQHETLLQDLTSGQQPVTQDSWNRIIGGHQLAPDERNAYVSGLMQRGGSEDAKGNQVQIEAINQQKDLVEKMNLARLDGDAKERQQVLDTYDKELEKLRQIAVIENTIADPKLRAAALAGNQDARTEAGDVTAERLTAIDAKQKAENQKIQNQLLAEKQKALNEVIAKETQLEALENKITEENLTGEARKKQVITDTTNAQIKQFTELAKGLGMSQEAIDAWIAKIKSGAVIQSNALHQTKRDLTDIQQVELGLANEFAYGFSQAFTAFADGSMSAKQAFGEFAIYFMEQMAEMIEKAMILTVIEEALGLTGGKSFSDLFTSNLKAADGGLFPRMMAAGGFAGMVSSPTYMPSFNVMAGEAGSEMLAVLARPTFRSVGGLDAVVGSAGNNRLALTNADDLANSGGGRGGTIHIQIDHTPETQARIVSQAVDGAEVRVTQNMQRNTPLRQSIRKGTT